jgi:hypothetical protein
VIRDLERADELSPGDKSVREALAKARGKAAALRAESMKTVNRDMDDQAEKKEGAQDAADADVDGNQSESLEQVMNMLRATRGDAKNMSDQQRRDAAARAAHQVGFIHAWKMFTKLSSALNAQIPQNCISVAYNSGMAARCALHNSCCVCNAGRRTFGAQ